MSYIGFFAALLTTISFVPQVIQIWKTNDTSSISLQMFVLFTAGVFLWLIHGIMQKDAAIIVANILTLFMASYILYRKIVTK